MLFSTTPGGCDLDGYQYWTVEEGGDTKLHYADRVKVQIPKDWIIYFNYHCSQKVKSQRRQIGGLISTSCGPQADIFNFESNFQTRSMRRLRSI